MIKFLKYFFEAIIVYIFFLIGKLLGLKNSKKIFSVIFQKVGPLFKSNEIVSTLTQRADSLTGLVYQFFSFMSVCLSLFMMLAFSLFT